MLPPRFSLVTGALLQGGDGLLDTVTDVGDDGRILDQHKFLTMPGGGGGSNLRPRRQPTMAAGYPAHEYQITHGGEGAEIDGSWGSPMSSA